MENVLEVYHRPFSKKKPLVCVDEISKQFTVVRLTLENSLQNIDIKYDNEIISFWDKKF
jgi:hypothetical protein